MIRIGEVEVTYDPAKSPGLEFSGGDSSAQLAAVANIAESVGAGHLGALLRGEVEPSGPRPEDQWSDVYVVYADDGYVGTYSTKQKMLEAMTTRGLTPDRYRVGRSPR